MNCDLKIDCPRCSGCGYPDCLDCAEDHAKRDGCWRCDGTGRVPCEMTGEHPLCGTWKERNGAICSFCDQPTGPDGCTACVIPLTNLADIKALFASDGGFDLKAAP